MLYLVSVFPLKPSNWKSIVTNAVLTMANKIGYLFSSIKRRYSFLATLKRIKNN